MVDAGVRFFVPGIPVPQGSKRLGRNRRTGEAVLIESAAALDQWRTDIGLLANQARIHARTQRLEGPVGVAVVFMLHRPARPRDMLPCVRPDVDKLVRAVLDGLTGALYADDGQVTDLTARKRYAERGQIGGADVTVWGVGLGRED